MNNQPMPSYGKDPVIQPAQNYPEPRRSRLTPWLIRVPLLAATSAILLVCLAILGVAIHVAQYDNLIYPGVAAYGVKLGGMNKQQAMAALSQRFTYGQTAIFTFRYGDRVWQKTAQDLGVSFDPSKTVDEAYQIGRSGNVADNLLAQADAWVKGHAIQPVIIFDQSKVAAFLQGLANGTSQDRPINQPVKDATITLTGTKVATTPSQIGRAVDIPATLGLLRPVVLNMNTGAEIQLVVHETQPAVKDSEVVAQKIRGALSAPIQITLDPQIAKDIKDPQNQGPWEISPDFIAGTLSIIRVDDGNGTAHYEVKSNLDPLKNFLNGLAPTMSVDSVNARFLFNQDTKQLNVISDSTAGRALDVDATVSLVQAALFNSLTRQVSLVFHKTDPTVSSTVTADQLGIHELISEATTFFYGSTAERKANIQVAAARFHGLVISPGEEFSFDKYLGDVSPETGFETGLVIVGNQTIAGVGGGVCQVSTTAFQAAFFAGFPIKERYAHGYRVGYYESGTVYAAGQKYTSGVGLDATVYSPIVDLKFVNDTPYYLLMETDFSASKESLTFRFYSTSTGRVVTKEGPTFGNTVAHLPNKYVETAGLQPGQQRQVDFAVDGVDVHVYRTITQNGHVIVNKEDFFSHYLPWSNIFQVAPGYVPKAADTSAGG